MQRKSARGRGVAGAGRGPWQSGARAKAGRRAAGGSPSCAIRFVPEEVRETLVNALRVDISNRLQKILINWIETLSSPSKEDAVVTRMV